MPTFSNEAYAQAIDTSVSYLIARVAHYSGVDPDELGPTALATPYPTLDTVLPETDDRPSRYTVALSPIPPAPHAESATTVRVRVDTHPDTPGLSARLPVHLIDPLLDAWFTAGSDREAFDAISTALGDHPVPLGEHGTCSDEYTYASALFRRTQKGILGPAIFPPPDRTGRYSVAGHTEPYPLAWPTGALSDALNGNLVRLWPHLTAEGGG